MGAWLTIIGGLLQLVFLILNNRFEKDNLEKKRKEDLHAKLTQAIKDKDTAAITMLLEQLRLQ